MSGDFRRCLVLLLFGFAPGTSSAAQEREQREALWIELCDTTGLEASALQAARDEASDIFATAKARLHWEGNCDVFPRTTPQSARIHIVPRMQESIANVFYQQRGIRNVMGYFGFIDDVRSNGTGKRAAVIQVARQAVEEVAGKSGRESLTDALLARAMGRVFAHELAHCFLGQGHTRTGILKGRLNQKDLIDMRNSALFFSPEQIRLLRLRIAQDGAAAER